MKDDLTQFCSNFLDRKLNLITESEEEGGGSGSGANEHNALEQALFASQDLMGAIEELMDVDGPKYSKLGDLHKKLKEFDDQMEPELSNLQSKEDEEDGYTPIETDFDDDEDEEDEEDDDFVEDEPMEENDFPPDGEDAEGGIDDAIGDSSDTEPIEGDDPVGEEEDEEF